MNAKDTVMSEAAILELIAGLNPYAMHRPNAIAKAQAEISFKAGINHVLSRAVQDGYFSTVNKKHGVHIPDELYSELKREAK